MKQDEQKFLDSFKKIRKIAKSDSADPNFTYDPKNASGIEINSMRSVGEHMMEHSDLLYAVIVPEWAKNMEFLSNEDIAKAQFENYYVDKDAQLPKNMWQVPIKIVFVHREYDYQIGSGEDLQNYSQKIIDYDQALDVFCSYENKFREMMKMINEYKRKHPNENPKY